jgi:hypothetical protein
MNKLIALSLLVLVAFTSHTYAAVSLKKAPVGKEVESWLKDCAKFQKLMPDLEQFFGCPTIEKFSYTGTASVNDISEAVNTKLNIKAVKSTPKSGVASFFGKFDGDFSGNFDLVREVEETDEEISFNEKIEKKFNKMSIQLESIISKEAKSGSAFYDENATWNGNFDGKPVEAEALVIVNAKDKSVTVYRIGYYINETI